MKVTAKFKTHKHPTMGKQWAQHRNFAKWQLRGIIANLANLNKHDVLLMSEDDTIYEMIDMCQHLIKRWDFNNPYSKDLFLEKQGGRDDK